VLPQGLAGVLGAEQPAPAEDRDHVIGECLEAGGQRGGHHVEAIGGALVEPVLDGVRDLLRGAGEGPVPPAAAEPPDQLADGQLLPLGQVGDQLRAALCPLDQRPAEHLGGQRPVQLQQARRHLQRLGQLGEPVGRGDQLFQLVAERMGLSLGRADHGHDARKDLDLVRIPAEPAGPPLHVRVELLAVGQGLLRGEDRLGVAGRELPAVLRRSGLH
jgi:hypothetical protein